MFNYTDKYECNHTVESKETAKDFSVDGIIVELSEEKLTKTGLKMSGGYIVNEDDKRVSFNGKEYGNDKYPTILMDIEDFRV